MSAETTPQISGALVRDQLGVMRSLYGDLQVDAAIDALSPAQRDELRTLTVLSWCTVATLNAAKYELARRAGVDPIAMQRKVVHTATERTLTTVWRFFIRQLSDDALLKRTPLLYSRTFNRGELTLVRTSSGTAEFSLHGWRDMHDFDCCGLATGIESVLTLSGRKNVHVTWARPAGEIKFTATWR